MPFFQNLDRCDGLIPARVDQQNCIIPFPHEKKGDLQIIGVCIQLGLHIFQHKELPCSIQP